MNSQYRCQNEGRRIAVKNASPPKINGIDYLEVASADQTTLVVHFLHPLPGGGVPNPVPASPPLTAANLRLEGGVRIEAESLQIEQVSSQAERLTIKFNQAGDFSTYTLRLVQSPTDLNPPPGFDPSLASLDFSFKVDCPSEFDCAPDNSCPPLALDEPEIDYLAKDYASFRRLMLDRLSVTRPGWREHTPADLQVALVELLAYVGDYLSYYQDAVATEAYLGTAHKRISVRRHARLLDYFMHDGCNARVWVCFEVEQAGPAEGVLLPPGTPLLIQESGPEAVAEKVVGFETSYALALRSSHNRINFYSWNDTACCLPAGSTRATLLDADDPALKLDLAVGKILLFEEILSPTSGNPTEADPRHRHAVRLTKVEPTHDPLNDQALVNIEWDTEDALPFPLCISAELIGPDGKEVLENVSVARANVVLADHGLSVRNAPAALLPGNVPTQGQYRPRLVADGLLTFQAPLDLSKSARAALKSEVNQARPALQLSGEGETWQPQFDLLSSDRFVPEFVVEVEADGVAYLRFGDGQLGRRPTPGANFQARFYRIGNGVTGNVGAGVITRLVWPGGGVSRVWNPLAATGGTDPEPIEEVRLYAPQAFRTQERAVTPADYAALSQRRPDVQRAVATQRWTGSWYTVFVTTDRKGGQLVNPEFRRQLGAYLERYRMAGQDLELNDPVFVPLYLKLSICVKPGYRRSDVKQSLLKVFSNRDLPGGQRGFFHPDNFTFGQPLYLSQIYQTAMQVAGVDSVEVTTFQRWGKTANQELENGVLNLGRLEVIRLDNDPNFAENGKLDFLMKGGL